MAVINTNLVCDLQKAVKVEYIDGVLFSQDNQANQINVTVLDGGEPATISGTVSANIIRSDGGTVAATGGSITGNVASITLPAAAYAVPGVVSIVVKLTVSGVITTIAAIVGNMYRSSTDTAIDPGTIIPSIQTLISQINAAVASIPADYSSLWTKLAPAFSTDASYVAGQYVTNNSGLYRFNTTHTGDWSSSDVTAVNLGGEITNLKSALGFQHYELTNSTNKELCKLYPVQGHRYCIYGNFNSYVTKIDFYEFYTDSTPTTKIKTITDGQLFEFLYTPTSAYVNYLRLYVTVSGGTGETECMIIDLNDSHADLSDMLRRMFVSSYGNKTILQNDNSCLGYTDVTSLPGNTIWSISADVTSSMLANLPTYGKASVLISFSARPYYTDNRSTIYLYMDSNKTAYIGLKTVENLYWKEITNDSVEVKVDEVIDLVGYKRFDTEGVDNKELGKIYPQSGEKYYIYGKTNSYVEYIDLYEFYSNETSERIARLEGGQSFQYIYTASNNVDYLRIYLTISGGTGTAECVVCNLSSDNADLQQLFNKMAVSAFTMDSFLQASNNCLGFSGVTDLPANKIFAVASDVTSNIFSDMPEYGNHGTVVNFAPRLSYTDNRFALYLYVNNANKVYAGMKSTGSIAWTELTNNYRDLFPGAQYYKKDNITANGELTKFYPESEKEYDVIFFDVTYCDAVLYEFDSNGVGTEYARLKYDQTNGRFHYKPTPGTVYLRLYCRYNGTGVEVGSAKAVILESGNVLSYASNRSLSDATDYLLSKEFAAVRKFTVIGDSLASGYYKDAEGVQHGRNLDYSWPQIMGRIYGQQVQNATQSGATTKSWWEDPNSNCKAMVTASKRSQVYIVGIGGNDYKDITPTPEQIGSSDDIDETDYNNNADTFWGNYCKILQYVHDVAPDAKIICLTVPIPPRPREDWKQVAIRDICAYPLFSDYVVLCDLDKDYADLINSPAMRAEVWHSHYTPVGYANSVELLMYAFSKTIQQNLEMFVDLPQIPFDPIT